MQNTAIRAGPAATLAKVGLELAAFQIELHKFSFMLRKLYERKYHDDLLLEMSKAAENLEKNWNTVMSLAGLVEFKDAKLGMRGNGQQTKERERPGTS